MKNDERYDVERMHRVSDMMITAHSHCRDRLSFLATCLEMSALALSVFVLAFTFHSTPTDNTLIKSLDLVILFLPWLGLIVFLLTIIQLKYDPSGQSALHGQAVDTLSTLKSDLNVLLKKDDVKLISEYERTRRYYDLTMKTSPPIKESLFLSLKAKHKRKVRISTYLDNHPNASLWLLRLKYWYADNIQSNIECKNDKQ